MTNEEVIKLALAFYGPMDIDQIQEKINMRGIHVKRELIDKICKTMQGIRPATGFDKPAYKV